jgi:hypothetical protein
MVCWAGNESDDGHFSARLLDIAPIALHDRLCRVCGVLRFYTVLRTMRMTHLTVSNVKFAAGGFGVALGAIGTA